MFWRVAERPLWGNVSSGTSLNGATPRGDFDMVNAMTNLVCRRVRKMDLPSWLPSRELSSWSDDADHTTATRGWLWGFLREDEGGHARRRHGGAIPDI